MEMKELLVEYSDQKVSSWGGMKLMKDLVARTGIKDQLRQLSLPEPGSNRAYDPVAVIESFWTSVWMGASRFCHTELLRYDNVLKEIF
jgi:hypothetical protein